MAKYLVELRLEVEAKDENEVWDTLDEWGYPNQEDMTIKKISKE